MVAIVTCYKLKTQEAFYGIAYIVNILLIYLTTVYSRDWVGCQRNISTDLKTGQILSFILCPEVLPQTVDDKSER